MYVLGAGTARLYRIGAAGQQVAIDDFCAGDICSLAFITSLVQPKSYLEVTSAAATVYRIHESQIRKLAERYPCINNKLLELAVTRLGQTYDRLEELALLDTTQRLATVLARKATANQQHHVPDTHEELGALVGARREQVTRVLSGMRRRGLVERASGHGVIIPDPDRLDQTYRP